MKKSTSLDQKHPEENTDPSSKKKKKRKPRVEWKYEVVQAEGELDIEGLAEILARMYWNAEHKRIQAEAMISHSNEDKPRNDIDEKGPSAETQSEMPLTWDI